MNKINSFKIIELSVRGFKNFAERQTFKFGSMTAILGHNGQGKSSIAEAITYAIIGIPFFGTESNLDRLYTIGSKNVAVELTIEVSDGSVHKLVRSRVNDKTEITYDGISIRQSDLTVMFGEKDVFLSVFNPLYFIEILGNEGRNLLERYLPPISHERILENLSESNRELLANKKMVSPEGALEKIRADIRNIESNIIYVEGQRDLLDSQINDSASLLQEKNDKLAEINNEISELEMKRCHGQDFATMKERLEGLYKHYDNLSRGVPTLADSTEIDAEILAVTTKLVQRRAEEFVSKFTQPIAETQAAIEQFKARYYKETAIIEGLAPGIQCPVCKQIITEQNIDSVKKAFDESIVEVMEKGRSLSAKLTELLEMEDKAKSVFEKFKSEDLKNLQIQLDGLQNSCVEKRGVRDNEMASIKEQIQLLEEEIEVGNLSADEIQTLNDLLKIQDNLMAEINVRSDENYTESAKFKADSDLENLKASIKLKRELENAVKSYVSERVHLMFADFDMLKRVKIVLYDIVKTTGEMKNTFKFSYEGRPYKYLSLSEKIRAGLEISELMKQLAGCNYPVFIDNGESVPIIDNVRPSGQVFVSQVVAQAPLKVEILSDTRTTAEISKAA